MNVIWYRICIHLYDEIFCDDLNKCTEDSCDQTSQCKNEPISFDDNYIVLMIFVNL